MFNVSSNLTAPCIIEMEDYKLNHGHQESEDHRKAEICCRIFREIFDFKNIEYIMAIMKFSLGSPLPQSLEGMGSLTKKRYQNLFPGNGNLSGLEDIGYANNYYCSYS